MARAFLFLALGLMCSFIGVAAVGLWLHGGIGDRHVLLAVFALIFDCFVLVITFTYFTVTGKMMAQAIHLGKLDYAPMNDVRTLKRSVTRCLGLAFLSVIFTTATGAAHWNRADQQTMHLLAVSVLFTIHCGVLYRLYMLIESNDALSVKVFAAYRKVRSDMARVDQHDTLPDPNPANVSQSGVSQ